MHIRDKLLKRRPRRPARAKRTSSSATFLRREKWWIARSEDVPGALTQGKTLAEAKANLRDAIRMMLDPAKAVKAPSTLLMRGQATHSRYSSE